MGRLEGIFFDVESDDAAGQELTLVALSGASVTPGTLRVNSQKAEVKDAPTYDPELELMVDQEAGACQQYGLAYEETARGARR